MVSIMDTLVENVITCGVCLKHFDEPRMLSCSHTFCLLCIQQMALENNGRMECPKNDGTTVEQNEINGLPMNEDLRKLVQVIDHPVANVPKCYRCENTNAEHWCDGDCKHSFCGRCWDTIHEAGQYRNHRKIPVKDKPLEMPTCKDHTSEDEKGKYWCEGCEKEICGNCQQLKHHDHKFVMITDIINDIEQQQENGLQSVQLCLNYRTDRAEKTMNEIKNESRSNQEKVTTTMATLRQLINDQEQTLLERIKTEEKHERNSFEQYKRNLQQEQQGLIKQICNVVDIRRDKQPKKLLEAKQIFHQYIKNMDTRLVDLKPLTRKKYEISGLDKVNELQTAIQNLKMAEQPKYVNDKLQQRINSTTDRSKLSLVDLQLNDMDMEIVANEMAINRALKTLELYSNQIGDLGAQYLADALRENNTVTNLQLHGNQIGNDGLEHFADALRTNKTLDKLALYKNNITNEIAQDIADGLKLNQKMEEQIRKINEIPRPTYTNPALQQRIANNGNNARLDLYSSNYTDDDMLIVAEMLKNNTVITTVQLQGNKIGDIGAQYLADALKENKTLTHLNLHTNKIGDLGAQYLADALKVNEKLQQLYLTQNQIGDQGAQYLADALKVNQTLTVLSVGSQITDNGARIFADVLKVNRTLQQLGLHQNQIGDQGAQYLADALKANQALKNLQLHYNQIGDNGAQYLAEGLKTNNTITQLNLQNTQIRDAGAQQLAEALKTNRTIQALYLYNNNISANVKTSLKQQDNRLQFN